MTEKSLLSMREIARELNVNYKMVVNYKNQLQELLPNKCDGYLSKYPAECVDLFRLISVLREEGYTFNMIRKLFQEQDTPPDDPEIKEWVSEWITKLDTASTDQDVPVHTCTYQDVPIPSSTDQDVSVRSNPDQYVPIHTETDQYEPAQTNSYLDEQVTTSTDLEELAHSETCKSLPDHPGSFPGDRLEEFLLKTEAEQFIQSYIASTLSHIQNQISDLIATQTPDLMAQLNASLTQFYKFCQTIAERMDRLESELGIEHAEQMELDLETLQVSQTQNYAYADLEFVRNSVSHGKPDKEAVRQWLVNERQINPAHSYATLAENLNQAGIPTLSGRDTWNRGTLRNLITER